MVVSDEKIVQVIIGGAFGARQRIFCFLALSKNGNKKTNFKIPTHATKKSS